MRKYANPVVIFLLFVALKISRNAAQTVIMPRAQNYYTAAIFEHARRGNSIRDTPEEIKRINLDYFMRAAKIAKYKGADVIVFPEYGIFPAGSRRIMKQYLERVPDPKVGTFNPCIQKHDFFNRPMLYNLSCTARQHSIVIVANIGDIQPCHPNETDHCPPDGSFHFNANVVFDKDGAIISRYYKEHLFFEPGMDLPTKPQDPVFTTDFGTFASFVCFDIMFEHIVQLAQDSRVDGIFLTTMWVDLMPLWNSVQTWQAWSMATKATIIAANLQMPSSSAVGSGVFTGNMGPLIYTFNPDGASKLLVSRVPKSKEQRQPFPNPNATMLILTANGTETYNENDIDFDHYLPRYCSRQVLGTPQYKIKGYRCMNENTVNYTLVKMQDAVTRIEVCGGMCCTLEFSALHVNESYWFGIANRTYSVLNRYSFCEETCLFFRCDKLDGEDCKIFPTKSSVVFEKFKIQANFSTPFVYPSVERTGMRLAPLNEWKHSLKRVNDQYIGTLEYEGTSDSEPLLLAALNGRCYDRDPPYIR